MERKSRRLILGSRTKAAMALVVVVLLALAAFFALNDPELGFELPQSRREKAATALYAVIGATVEPLDGATAESLGISPRDTGLIVTSLGDNGPAAEAGLRAGDVIERIGGAPVGSLGDASAALKSAPPSDIFLTLNRRGHYSIVQLPIRPAPGGRGPAKQGGMR